MVDLSSYRVVITDCMHLPISIEEEEFDKYGIKPELFGCYTEEQTIAACKNADAVMVHFAPLTKRVIDTFAKVKIIANYGVGVDNIDIPAATAKGIMVTNVQNYCTNEVADHALTLLLVANRKILQADRFTRKYDWEITNLKPVEPFEGKQLGLIGYGAIGSAFARRARTLGCRIMVYDPYVNKEKVRAEGNEVTDSLDDLLENSDFISLHLPLTAETRYTIGEKELNKMKKSCIIINTSRGPLIKEADLLKALQNGVIKHAALDVFEVEPPPKSHPAFQGREQNFVNPLCELPAELVTLTPHMAWYSTNSYTEIKRVPAQEVIRALQGIEPKYLLNKNVLSKR